MLELLNQLGQQERAPPCVLNAMFGGLQQVQQVYWKVTATYISNGLSELRTSDGKVQHSAADMTSKQSPEKMQTTCESQRETWKLLYLIPYHTGSEIGIFLFVTGIYRLSLPIIIPNSSGSISPILTNQQGYGDGPTGFTCWRVTGIWSGHI